MDRPSTPTTFASAPVEESAKGTADKLKLNFYLPHEVAHDEEEVRERCETRWDGDRPMGLRPTSGRRGFDPTRRRRARTRDEARVGRGARINDRAMVGWWRAASDDAGSRSDD